MPDAARERFADPAADPRQRLKRLRLRAESLRRDEAAWSIEEALQALFKAAEALLIEAATSAAAAEALDQIFVALGELMDAVDPA
jgi:hypothetical protein